MSKYSNTVEYNIRTTLDSSGIAKLQGQLTQLQNHVNSLGAKGLMGPEAVSKTLGDINKVKTALTEAFNPKLGMLNMSQFMSNLKNQGMSLKSIYNSFSQAGMAGQRAFMSMYGQINKMDMGLKSMSKTTDKIINTFGNTFRWGVIASGFAAIMNSVHQAAQYTKELDESLTNIMMVSGITRDNMNEYARVANQVAKQLGSTTVAMTNATQVFVQQGYDLPTSQRLAEYSTVLGNVSQQDTATASDELTAYMNAFKIPLDQIGNALSKWAEVANVSAADVEELSVASQKAASVAATVGVDMDQLAATIATIETVTREAPENIGNGLKTIYSRLSDIKLGKTLDDGVNLGQITKQLDKVGVQVLDQQGQMREVGSIVEDLMAKWKDMSMTERAATATTLAGRFQLARFESLMNRSDLYESYLKSSREQTGTETLDFMQETFEDSLQGRLNTLQSTVEETFLNIFDSSSFYGAVDALTTLVETLNDLIKAVGGGSTAILGIVAALSKLASASLARGISNFVTNRMAESQASKNTETIMAMSRNQIRAGGLQTGNKRVDDLTNTVARVNQHIDSLSEEEQVKVREQQNKAIAAEYKRNQMYENRVAAEERYRIGLSATLNNAETPDRNLPKAIAQAANLRSDTGIMLDFNSDEANRIRNLVKSTAESFAQLNTVLDLDQASVGKKQLNLVADGLQQLVDKGVIAEDKIDLVNQAISNLKSMKSGADATREVKQELQQCGVAMTEFATHVGTDIPKNAAIAINEIHEFDAALVDIEAEADDARGHLTGIGERLDLREKIQGVINFGNALMSITFAFQSLRNLANVLSDDSLDPWERFEQTAMNLGMVLAMTGPVILDVHKKIKDVRQALKIFRESETAVTIATRGLSLETFVYTVANKGLVVALRDVWKSMLPILAVAGPYIAMATAIGVVIAGIVVAVKGANAEFHKFDTAVENAEQKVKSANANFKQAKEELKQVQETLTNIKNDDDAFKGLTKGTIEWTNALVEANQQVLDLIEKYPELGANRNKYLTTGDYGQLTLTPSGRQKVIDLAQQDIAKAQSELYFSQRGYVNAKNNQTRINTARAHFGGIIYKDTQYWGDEWGQSRSWTDEDKVLADTEKIARDYEKAVGKGTKKALDDFINTYKDVLILDENGNIVEEQITAMRELTKAENANTVQLQAWQQSAAAAAMAGNVAYGKYDSNLQKIIQNTIASYYDESSPIYKKIAATIPKDEGEQKAAYAKSHNYIAGKDGKYYSSQENLEQGVEVKFENIDIVGSLVGEGIADYVAKHPGDIVKPVSDAFYKIEKSAGADFANIFAGGGQLDEAGMKNYLSKNATINLNNLDRGALIKLGFNAEDPFADLEKQIADFVQTHPVMLSVQLGSDFDFDSDREVDDYLENYTDIDRSVLDTATSLKVSEYQPEGDRVDNQAIALAKYDEALKEVDKDTEDYNRLLAERTAISKDAQYNNRAYEKTMQRLAAAEARATKTLKEMTEHFEDNYKTLQNKSIRGTVEYAEALAQTKKDLAGILDVDASSFTDAFAEAPETLEKLNTILNGTAEEAEQARQELGQMAAMSEIQSIEIPLGTVDPYTQLPVTTEDIQNSLISMIEDLNSQNLGIGVEADIDTAEWYNKVNELLRSGLLTQDQLTSILSKAGYKGEVKTHPVPAPSGGNKSWNVEFGGIEADGITLPGFSTKITLTDAGDGDMIEVPYLEGISGGGGITDAYQSANKGSSGKGGGGGGGGSKGKTIKAVEAKTANIDPYQKVNAELEKLGDHYTEVDKAKGRMYGDKYRRAAQEEIKNLQDQNKKLEERIDISKKLLEAYQTGQDNPEYGIYLNGESLDKYGLTDSDFDGIIDNRWDRIEQLYLDYQAKLNAANALAGEDRSEAEQEEFDRLNEIAEEAHELWAGAQDFVGEYEDTWNKIRDDTQKIQDNMYEMEDIAIDLFQIATETVDNLKDLNESKGWLQGFYTGDKSDSPFRAMVEDLSVFNGLLKSTTYEANSFFQSMIDNASDDTVRQFWEGVRDEAQSKIGDGTSILDMRQFYLEKLLSDEGRAIYGSNEKQYIEDLEKLYNDIIGDMKDIESLQEKIIDDIIDGYGKINEDIAFANEQWEYGIQLLEHQTEMAELLHGEDAYDMFGVIDQALVDATLEKADKARWQYDYWVEQRDKYDKETQKEIWEDLDKRAREFGEALQEATKEAADAMLKQYQDATENIIKNLRDELFGGTLGDAAFFDKEWEMANDRAEQHLDSVERSMELEKLRLRYQKMLDDTNDLPTQNKIKQAMNDQLKALENQQKAIINNQGELEYINALSQFDVDLANAKVEALQKQIALEEAQRNKNQMQLRRDTQGNYRYVYRANEEDLMAAQEELADSEYEIYEMSKERYSDVLNERWQVQQEYEEKLRFANERYKDDQEKLQKALYEINNWYKERQVNLGLELQDAQAGMIEGVKHLAEDTTDYVAQTFADVATAMEDNWAKALGDIGVIYDAELANLTEDTDGFIARIDQVQNDTVDAAEQFDEELRDLEEAAKTSFTNIAGNVDNITHEMQDLNAETEKFMGMIKGDTGEIDAATAKLESYRKEIESLKNSSSALASTLADTQQQLDNANRDKQVYKTNIENVAAGNGYFDENGEYHAYERKETSGASNASDRDTAWGIAQNIWTYGSWGNGQTRVDRITDRFGAAVADLTQQYLNEYINSGRMYELLNWDSDELYGYATGGYTGTWSKDDGSGRVALLHQKELVLNESDTENMLAAVDMVRQAVNMLKGSGGSSLSGVFNTLTGQPIEQRVSITAEFPNVDTADDIRQALLGLADNAFQYAYKTR